MVRSNAVCALCGVEAELQESHIIPAFAVRWLRETSATGHIRHGANPSRRVQDGLKDYMLCLGCETEFSRHERDFKNRLFDPFNNDPGRGLRYGPWLERFCVSVSWRVLRFLLDDEDTEARSDAQAALDRWRDYLLNRTASPGPFKQHVVPIHPIGNALSYMPSNINRYLLRSIDADYVGDGNMLMTYAKVGRVAVFGLVTKSTVPWHSSLVRRTGALVPASIAPPNWMLEYFSQRAVEHQQVHSEISEPQKDKIEAAMERDMHRSMSSASADAMRHDARLFGRAAITRNPKGPLES